MNVFLIFFLLTYILFPFKCETNVFSLQVELSTLRVTDSFSGAWLPVLVSGR